MSNGHLNQLLEQITDSNSFIAFARALENDRRKAVAAEQAAPDHGGWENTSIENFLEAAVSWAEDSDFGVKQGLSPSNPWKQFGVFLYCGKIYE